MENFKAIFRIAGTLMIVLPFTEFGFRTPLL